MPNTESLEWLRVKDVAAKLNVTPMSVYRLIEAGKLPATRATPRSVRIRAADLDAYLRAQSNAAAEVADPWEEYLASTRASAALLHPDAVLAEDVGPDDFAEEPAQNFIYILTYGSGDLWAMFPADGDPRGLSAAWNVCKVAGGSMRLCRVQA